MDKLKSFTANAISLLLAIIIFKLNHLCGFVNIIFLSAVLTYYVNKHEYKIKSNNTTAIELKKMREAFVNSLNHDLRIPIIAQLRAIEIINNEQLGSLNKNQKEFLKQIEDSGRCILNLISIMINTYNIENCKHNLLLEKINVNEVIKNCFKELIPEASEKNITFEYECNKNITLTADKDDFHKVIYNLLITSITHSNFGEKISIKVINTNKNKIRLLIFRKNNEYTKDFNDIDTTFTTIGQSIRMHYCRKLIENHNGEIIDNDTNPGLFIFELPQNINP